MPAGLTTAGFAGGVAAGWKAAYAAMHRDGAAEFSPACLHYILECVRVATRQRAQGMPQVAQGDGISLTPAETVAAFRRATEASFGPLRVEVLEDWGLRTPEDLGRAVLLLARYGCLTLDAGDDLESFAADAVPFLPRTEGEP